VEEALNEKMIVASIHPAESLVHVFEERVISMQVVVFSCANVHVSSRVCAILRREPVAIPVVSIDFGHIVTQNHHMVAMRSGIFLASFVVMVYGLKMTGRHTLVLMPRQTQVGAVHCDC
jgi:hypothetical protein